MITSWTITRPREDVWSEMMMVERYHAIGTRGNCKNNRPRLQYIVLAGWANAEEAQPCLRCAAGVQFCMRRRWCHHPSLHMLHTSSSFAA
jgi:hypothetical protein